jgi:CBS-domain-containing membrane protein
MALAVAGYTQSVGAVFNPTVGIDTIRRMGATYFKAFGMVLAVQVAVLVFSVAVSAITEPLALPFFGNVLAKFIDGTVAFYFNLVIACVLGLSLFKCADRLGISVD